VSDRDGGISPSSWSGLLELIHTANKSLWMCPSFRELERWRAALQETLPEKRGRSKPSIWVLGRDGDELDQFSAAEEGHLFSAGRYDGMDFEGDRCRLAVLPDMPRAVSPLESFVATYLRDADFIQGRIATRFAQALGRCNRSNDDYAVYVLYNPEFAAQFTRSELRRHLSPEILTEVDRGILLTEEERFANGINLGRTLLGGDIDTVRQNLGQMPAYATSSSAAATIATAPYEVAGWAAMALQDYRGAVEQFTRCVEALQTAGDREYKAFWHYCRSHAEYLRCRSQSEPAAMARAIDDLETCIRIGAGVSVWFNRLQNSLNGLRAQAVRQQPSVMTDLREALFSKWDSLLETLGTTGVRFEEWINGRVLAPIESPKHDIVRNAVVELGRLLGYASEAPGGDAASDVRWLLPASSTSVVAIEIKAETDPEGEIPLRHISQCLAQREAEVTRLGPGTWVGSLLITNQRRVSAEAATSRGPVKLIHRTVISTIARRLTEILRAYRALWSSTNLPARQQARRETEKRLPPTGFFRVLIEESPEWIAADFVNDVWKRSTD